MPRLTRIGYWQSATAPDLPDPATLVDPTWDEDERSSVASYFAYGTVARAYMGISSCRLCGIKNGNLEFTDGTYLWPEGLVHYIREHGVRMPDAVVAHAEARLAEVEDAQVDDAWWVRHHRP